MEKEEEHIFNSYRVMARFKSFPHPEKLVETSILASVQLENCNDFLSLLQLIDKKDAFLSGPQLESVILASKAHQTFLSNNVRKGFILGDGAGVGKGRQISGMILENYLLGRKKSLWLSASRDLVVDAQRDIKALTHQARIDIRVMEAPKDFNKIETEEGVLFITYSLLCSKKKVSPDSPLSISKPKRHSKTESSSDSDSDSDITLDSASSKYDSDEETCCFTNRMDQVFDWLGQDYEGLVILDESHKAKGYKPKGLDSKSKSSACGMAVHELQTKFPLARVVYVSATLATHPDDIIYMERSGLWGVNTAFPSVIEFTKSLESRGIAALEHLPVELKERGIYLSRHIAMDGVEFSIDTVKLEEDFEKVYEDSCSLWHLMYMLALIKMEKKKMGNYFAECQRFFRSLCVSSKLIGAVEMTREAVSKNKSVIIGIQSTGEAAYMRYKNSKFHSTSIPFSNVEMILEEFLTKQLEISPTELGLVISKKGVEKTHYATIAVTGRKLLSAKRFRDRSDNVPLQPSTSKEVTCQGSKKLGFIESLDTPINSLEDSICDLFKSIKHRLPTNPLDELIEKLGGSDKVIELTGRVNCQKINKNKDGTVEAINVKRDSTRSGFNLFEQKRFQNGEADIVIISEAASTGISLHSSRTFKNQKKRLHIMLEFPWSASSALQQIGRTNRSNQASKPQYSILISKIPCEKRFATAVGQRMATMGAMTKGDRRSASSDVWGRFDLDHQLAKKAIISLMKCIMGKKSQLSLFLDTKEHQQERLLYVKIFEKMDIIKIDDDDKRTINSRRGQFEKFMNRILACPIVNQKQIIEWFNLALLRVQNSEIDNEESSIKELIQLVPGKIKDVTTLNFKLPDGHNCNLKLFDSVSGTDYEQLLNKIEKVVFYKKVSIGLVGKEKVIAIEKIPFKTDPNRYSLKIHTPSEIHPSNHPATFVNDPTYHEISQHDAKVIWMQQYGYMARGICENEYWLGIPCLANKCSHPRSTKRFGIISGGCINIWDHVNAVMKDPITLVKGTVNDNFHVGIYVPPKEVEIVENTIKIICDRKVY